MAKITVLLGELSGSIAGNTFSRNKAGAYVRQRVTPTDAKSEAQMAVRARFAAVGAGFHAMNAFQKSLWNAFATSIFTPVGGRIAGVTYTGQQSYVSLNQRIVNASAAIASNPSVDVGAYGGTTFDTLPTNLIETPPTLAFSSNLSDSGGGAINQQLQGINFTGSNGQFTANMRFMGGGSPVAPAAPTWVDPVSGDNTGYLLFGSDVVEQAGLAPKNIYKNLLAFVPAPTVFTGTYTPSSTFTVTGNAVQLNPRKSWYNAGAVARFSLFAISMDTGQTQLIGSLDSVVQ